MSEAQKPILIFLDGTVAGPDFSKGASTTGDLRLDQLEAFISGLNEHEDQTKPHFSKLIAAIAAKSCIKNPVLKISLKSSKDKSLCYEFELEERTSLTGAINERREKERQPS